MCKCNKGTRLPHSFARGSAVVIWEAAIAAAKALQPKHKEKPAPSRPKELMRICVAILQVALHRITVTVVRLLTVQPDCKTAGICNLRQIILSSVIIYACHIKQSTDNQCASTMYFVISEYSIALQSCQALIYRIDTKCKQCRIFCRGYTVSPGIPD